MTLKLFACGDVVNLTSNNNFIDDKLVSIIQNCDISICNFEAPIETQGMEAINKAGPHVYQSKNSIQYLSEVGFDIVSLANNHIYDYGQSALENTIDELNKYDIEQIGGGINFNSAYTTKIIDKNGVKIGLIGGCENEFGCLYEKKNRGGYAWLLHYIIEDNIRDLKQKVDSVVLIAHAGVEDIDFPIKEWREIYKRFCDIGVDVIIGHHPHVPQGYEKYNGSMIFYSLGNFYFDTAGFENKSDDSYSVVINFENSGFKDYEIIYHKKIGNQVFNVSNQDVSFDLNYLNSLLTENYEQLNNDISIELFKKYYYGYYEQALGVSPNNSTIFTFVKYMVKRLLLNHNNDLNNLLLLHNIRIDSHRFVVQRALSLISET